MGEAHSEGIGTMKLGNTTSLLALCALASLTVAGDWSLSQQAGDVIAARQAGQKSSVYANLAGQFRTVAANLLWIKADTYHHEFVENNPHWTKNTDLLPLFRMITWLDPHFTQAYASGAWMLGLYENRPGQARAFLAEGLRNNPGSMELHEAMAILAYRCERNLQAACFHLEKARDAAPSEFDRERFQRSVENIKKRMAGTGKPPASEPLTPEEND